MKFSRTPRGFAKYEFKDYYGHDCSLQESSLANEACIWLGRDINDNLRMHLTRSKAAILVGLLQHFIENGDLPEVNFHKLA